MKKFLLFLFVFLWIITFAFAQGASIAIAGPIKLKPTQVKVLANLDSVRNVFSADVEKNKEAINTFNALMQRSTSLVEQQKQAYNLIMDAAGYDPKKYKVTGYDLKKGELTVETK